MESLLYIFYILVNLVLLAFIIYFLVKITLVFLSLLPTYKGDCPYVPTKDAVIQKAFKMLEIEKGDEVLDIGSGDGKVLLKGAKQTKANFTGVEINSFLNFLAKVKKGLTYTKGKVNIIKADFKEFDFAGFDKIFMFSMPSLIEELLPKIQSEVDNGTYIASIKFPLEADFLEEKKVESVDHEYDVFLYEKKESSKNEATDKKKGQTKRQKKQGKKKSEKKKQGKKREKEKRKRAKGKDAKSKKDASKH